MIPEPAILRLPCAGPLRASVILLHGYAAAAAVHVQDARAFVDAGTEVLIPDAPGHGRREDGRLETLAGLPDAERPAAIHGIAREWLSELPELVAGCRERGASRVGVVGISMGGFAALGALAQPSPFDAVAAVLAAPALVDRAALRAGHPPLLLGLAGRDSAVPPEPGRRFAEDYGAELLEYPESDHMMRGEDWFDLWDRTGAFLRRHLGANGAPTSR